ncbi:fatty acyl-CoA reductase 1 isoform X2 [Solenopsis invicta]|uniref:fatty acyl-CoA reductase 1 isoform X2 n=1 Tax=Solenopsis invicta TaxID=13686 RepID=UPI000E33D899|nr:fatty acyl-CoA reductase 1 isoform X2 [Solenopsis invicta]
MEKNSDDYIPAFFENRSIFITGGTGFIGKVLIEKLLRSCPGVAEIFVLIRPKKGLNVNERIKKMLDNKLFDVLRSKQPSSFDKIIPITGDIAAENLGMIKSEREMLIERVSIIFHVAASVRFDDALKEAVFINTRSTRDICILAQSMKNLNVLLHVSSTYTQTDKRVVEEIVYPLDVDWQQMIKISESVDDFSLKILTAKFLDTMPNTYTFTKRLAEQVINDYSESLPCVLIRPSIIINAADEPLKGWIDNFNGPIGMLIGGGTGLIRVVFADKKIMADYVPVDAAVKIILIATCKHGIKAKEDKNKMIEVYNCSSNQIKSLEVGQMVDLGLSITKDVPIEKIIYNPGTTVTKNYYIYYTLMLTLHILPALFLDTLMKLFGARPILLKLQRKVYVSNNALSYFLLNEWKFYNEKVLNLLHNISEDNKEEFGFPYEDLDLSIFYKNGLIGSKLYLLNEKMENLDSAKRHYKRMKWIDIIVKTLFVVTIVWILYRKNAT